MTKRSGFTLAEVLITLGIIGVVAAMTIPTLMNQTSQVEFKTGFKKMISTLNQAVTMNVALNSTDFSLLQGSATTAGTIYDMFTTRMNVMANDSAANTTLDPTGTVANMSAAGNYTIFFNDGMALSWPKTNQGCIDGSLSCDALVDVNGVKKPNRLTNCNTSSSATTDTVTTCTATSLVVGDRFSIRFAGQSVSPNGFAARYVMYQ